ncbi:MAG: hypothetical protein J5750_05980, partial [Clostridiales bacterium]|nr:hypothetical protein [Clostridiales bacterium]
MSDATKTSETSQSEKTTSSNSTTTTTTGSTSQAKTTQQDPQEETPRDSTTTTEPASETPVSSESPQTNETSQQNTTPSSSAEDTTTPEPTETTPKPTTPEPATYKVVVKTQTGGTVSGGGEFKAGDKVTITATADAGYHFVNWKNLAEGTTISTATYTFTMPANDLIFKPVFEQDATTPEPTKYYYAEVDVQFVVSFTDENGTFHS